MTAIQRWHIDWDYGQIDGNVRDVPEVELWCKAKDVVELERVIAEQSANHQVVVDGLRRQLARANRQIDDLQDDGMSWKDATS